MGEVTARLSELQLRVLDFVRARGEDGATDEEIAEGLGEKKDTTRPRRVELAQYCLVHESGRRRKTAMGRMAMVWVAGAGRAERRVGRAASDRAPASPINRKLAGRIHVARAVRRALRRVRVAPEAMTAQEAGDFLSLARGTIWRLSKQKRIPGPVLVAGAARWRRDELQKFVQESPRHNGGSRRKRPA
jgi:predicted DNA-binding transcriptional regulator AlpA